SDGNQTGEKSVRKPEFTLTVALAGALFMGGSALAQAPNQSQIDAHMIAARQAAGMEHRNTFINLCPVTPPNTAGRGGRGGAAGRGAGAPATPDRANWYA